MSPIEQTPKLTPEGTEKEKSREAEAVAELHLRERLQAEQSLFETPLPDEGGGGNNSDASDE